jgi:hypothetical protein
LGTSIRNRDASGVPDKEEDFVGPEELIMTDALDKKDVLVGPGDEKPRNEERERLRERWRSGRAGSSPTEVKQDRLMVKQEVEPEERDKSIGNSLGANKDCTDVAEKSSDKEFQSVLVDFLKKGLEAEHSGSLSEKKLTGTNRVRKFCQEYELYNVSKAKTTRDNMSKQRTSASQQKHDRRSEARARSKVGDRGSEARARDKVRDRSSEAKARGRKRDRSSEAKSRDKKRQNIGVQA